MITGIRRWATAPKPMFGAFVAAVAVTYLIPKHTLWLPQPGAVAIPVALFPLPGYVWQTVGWMVLIGLFVAILLPGQAGTFDDRRTDAWTRRLAIVALAGMWSFALASRILAGKTYEPSTGAVVMALAAVCFGAAAILALRPPPTTFVVVAVIAGGLIARMIGIAVTPMDENYTDNLPAIIISLDRLVHGATPYAMIDFGTHVNPMGYLPWTVLAYLPPFLGGADVRLTNVVLSLALVLGLVMLLSRLGLPAGARGALSLLAAVTYAAPNAIGFDLHTEWQFFSLALVGAFALLMVGRTRTAAASYGLALAAMPMALFSAPALCALILRTKGWREFVVLTSIVISAASPILAFLLWDAEAFIGAASSAPLGFWQRLDAGDTSWPYLLAWHGWLPGTLRFVQLAGLTLIVLAAWHVRTPVGALRLAIASYLGLALSGPFIAPHVFMPVLWLVLIASALKVAQRRSVETGHAERPPIAQFPGNSLFPGAPDVNSRMPVPSGRIE